MPVSSQEESPSGTLDHLLGASAEAVFDEERCRRI